MPLGRWLGKDRYLSITLPGKAGLTASQISDWMVFDQLEPIDHQFRAELRHGQSMALQCNLNRDPKTKSEPWNALEFMNYVDKPLERVYTAEELEKYADSIFG